MANTGKLLYTRLKKVTDDGTNRPLDVNNNLVSVSGLPQDTKENVTTDPDYVPGIQNPASCPVNVWSNEAIFARRQKQCTAPAIGSWETYTVPAGRYTSTISQADANNQALADINANAQNHANTIGSCTLNTYTFTRSDCFFRSNCPSEFPTENCVPYSKVYTSNISQADANAKADADYGNFLAEGQAKANNEGVCEGMIEQVGVDVVTGDPCSGTRTPTTLWLNNNTQTYYTNAAMTILANGIYWLSGQTEGRFMRMVNGKITSTINDVCTITGPFRWKDLGRPNSISRYGNIILAAYADQNIVVRYDTSTGTNPLGTIIAGERYKYDTGATGTQNHYLNAPTLVRWRDDGDRFVVYSGGFFKTLKVFSANGTYLYRANGEQFDYKTPTGNNFASEPVKTDGVFGQCTPYGGENLDNFWDPQKLDYSRSEYGYDVLLFGCWNKRNNGENRYRIHLILMYSSYFGMATNYTQFYENYNYFDEGFDMICDFAITKKQMSDSDKQATRYEVAFVLPRTYARENKYRNYHLIELSFTHINYYGVSWFENVGTRDMGHFRNVFGTGNTDWRENVRIDCNYVNGNLYVLIKAFNVSKNDYTRDWVKAGAAGATLGAGLAFFFVGISEAIPTLGTLWTISASLSITTVGAVVGVAIMAAAAIVTWLLRPAKKAGTGFSRLTLSQASPTTYTYNGGAAAPGITDGYQQWVPAFSAYGVNTFMDCNRVGDDFIYCLDVDKITRGYFNGMNYTNLVMDIANVTQ